MRFITALQPTITSTLALSSRSRGLSAGSRYRRWSHSKLVPTTQTRTSLLAGTDATPKRPQLETTSSSPPPPVVQIHESFSDIIDQYDAFILDQFGVLHNGVEPLDGAVELVQYLHEKKKKMIILSNTSAPSKNAMLRLKQLGFSQDYFIDAITSGEESSRHVRMTYREKKTLNVIFVTWDVRIPNNPRLTALPQAFLDACCCSGINTVHVTNSIADADLFLLHGSEVWYRGTDEEPMSLGSFITTGNCHEVIDPLLEQIIQYQLPVICANPDEIVVTPTGGTAYMPGKIVQRYIELGGTNYHVFGKPNVEHFEACIRQLQNHDSNIQKHRVAHVGDSLHHDIIGANHANIASVFITSGIHASQLNTVFGELPNNPHQSLHDLFEQEGSIYPTHVVPAFRL